MFDRVSGDERDVFGTQVTRRPDRAVFRINEVRTATRVRGLAHVNQSDQLVFFGVDNGNLVRSVGGNHEVTAGRIETAIVQEAGRVNRGRLQIVEIRVVDHIDLAGFLRVDDELRMVVRCHDGCDARFRVVFLWVNRHAASRHNLQRLQRRAIHDDVLRRPVGTGNRILVFIALVLRCFNRTGFQTDTDFGNGIRLGHPQIDQVDLAVAADHIKVTTRGRDARNMHGIACWQNRDDLLGVAINEGNFTAVTQGDREDVGNIETVFLLLGALIDGDHDLPGAFHVLHAEFRRGRRLLLDITRHQIHFGRRQLTARTEVRHTGGRTVGNEGLQIFGTICQRFVGSQRFTRGTLTQHTVAAGAAFKIDLARLIKFSHGHLRGFGVDVLVHLLGAQWRTGRLVLRIRIGGLGLSVDAGNCQRKRRQRQKSNELCVPHLHFLSPQVCVQTCMARHAFERRMRLNHPKYLDLYQDNVEVLWVN